MPRRSFISKINPESICPTSNEYLEHEAALEKEKRLQEKENQRQENLLQQQENFKNNLTKLNKNINNIDSPDMSLNLSYLSLKNANVKLSKKIGKGGCGVLKELSEMSKKVSRPSLAKRDEMVKSDNKRFKGGMILAYMER